MKYFLIAFFIIISLLKINGEKVNSMKKLRNIIKYDNKKYMDFKTNLDFIEGFFNSITQKTDNFNFKEVLQSKNKKNETLIPEDPFPLKEGNFIKKI